MIWTQQDRVNAQKTRDRKKRVLAETDPDRDPGILFDSLNPEHDAARDEYQGDE